MTLSRQLRHKARARRAAEPYLQEHIDRVLEISKRDLAPVIVETALGGEYGFVLEIGDGWVSMAAGSSSVNIPRKKITNARFAPLHAGHSST